MVLQVGGLAAGLINQPFKKVIVTKPQHKPRWRKKKYGKARAGIGL
jgi:hypothetical protein